MKKRYRYICCFSRAIDGKITTQCDTGFVRFAFARQPEKLTTLSFKPTVELSGVYTLIMAGRITGDAVVPPQADSIGGSYKYYVMRYVFA